METGENNTTQQAAPAAAPQATAPVQADNNTIMGVLAYLGILIIIPFLTAKENPFVKFHIKQGLVLIVIWGALWVLGMVGGYMLWSVLRIANLGLFVLAIIGIVNVINKKEAELPLVGAFAKHFNNI